VISASLTSGDAPLTVTFDISSSYDPDGTIVSYELDFGDGTPPATGTDVAQPITHTYASKGIFTAALTVTDDDGATGTAALEITVLKRIPLSQGESVTIIECTGEFFAHTFPVSQIITTGVTFTTAANEEYTVKSNGILLTILCQRYPPHPDGPMASGHNIDSVELVLPNGRRFFAGEIISVIFGENAIRGSEENIIGPTDGEITYLGDIFSSITVGFIEDP